VLVNCAGILQSGKRVLEQDLDEDETMWRVNYRGTLLGCQIFGRLMSAAGRGAILNVGSLASFAPLSLPAYTPGKRAIVALTEMAAELGMFRNGWTTSETLQRSMQFGTPGYRKSMSPAWSSGQGRTAKPGMLVELIVTAAV
jgi:NAD(P)-dependent dehydrogenase (short-subunit alcohol dehydrogenase family)